MRGMDKIIGPKWSQKPYYARSEAEGHSMVSEIEGHSMASEIIEGLWFKQYPNKKQSRYVLYTKFKDSCHMFGLKCLFPFKLCNKNALKM